MGRIINRRRYMGQGKSPFIHFKDEGTKALCVEKFGGANGGTLSTGYRHDGVKVPGVDGELTYEQAASIIHVYNLVFTNKTTLGSFDEFRFFTGFTSVEKQSFSGSSITSIVVPNSVQSIGNSSFSGCRQLETIRLPDSVVSIGDSVFSSCSALSNINIPTSVVSIGSKAFQGCASLTSLELPEGLVAIPSEMCYRCSSLENCNIPSTVTSIGNSAFQSAPIKGHLNIPYGVTSIGYGTFWGTKFTSVTLPESLTTIKGARAFHIDTLLSVTFPSSLEVLGAETFYGCTSLAEIKVLATVPPSEVTNTTFSGVPASTKIQVPAESVDAYKTDSGWSTYASRIIAIEE